MLSRATKTDSTRNTLIAQNPQRIQRWITRVIIIERIVIEIFFNYTCIFFIIKEKFEVRYQIIKFIGIILATMSVSIIWCLLVQHQAMQSNDKCMLCSRDKVVRFLCSKCQICVKCRNNIKRHSYMLDICVSQQIERDFHIIFNFSIFQNFMTLFLSVYEYNSSELEDFILVFLIGIFFMCGVNLLCFATFKYILYNENKKQKPKSSSKIQQNPNPKPSLIDNKKDITEKNQDQDEKQEIQEKNLTLIQNQQNDEVQEKKEIKRHIPNLEDLGCSIEISPLKEKVMQESVNSRGLTPSPGKYRSGKIIDYLDKKLSNQQSNLANSQQLSKKFIFMTDIIAISHQSIIFDDMGSKTELNLSQQIVNYQFETKGIPNK